MTRIIAVANQKGGVGKTTTTVNLAAGLAQAGRRVLLVDLDPQGNATMGSGIDKRALTQTNRELAGAEVEMVDLDNRETRLKGALAIVAGQYDFILLDCPPSLSLLTLNGFVAADAVMIPMQCEYYALEGLTDLINTIKKVRAHFNPAIEIEGLLRTMFDPRNTLSQQVSDQLQQHFPDKIYETIIPRNVRLAEAPSYGTPAIRFDAGCKGSVAYLELTDEILGRAGARLATTVAG
jgi:chromosome partitioning protein